MKFGIFSNSRRPGKTQDQIWDADLREIEVADRVGMDEAWISEHDSPAELIICKAAAMTSRISLGSAVRPLAYYHPLQVATEANACDHLTKGRYRLGIGFGFYAAQMERRGLDFSKTREMMHASIDLILKLWTAKGPIDYDGPFWKGKAMELRPKAYQDPHPPVAVAVGNTPSTVELAGKNGFQMLTGDFISVKRLNKFNGLLAEAQAAHGRPVERSKMACTRVIYVSDTDKKAREEMRESYERTIAWEKVNTPHHQVDRIPPGGTLDDVTYDYLVDSGNLFIGSPATVSRKLLEFYEDVGGFGLLMCHAGRDYATPELRERSMRMFMDEVAPKLRPLDCDKDPPKPSDRLKDAYDNERSPELHAQLARYKIA